MTGFSPGRGLGCADNQIVLCRALCDLERREKRGLRIRSSERDHRYQTDTQPY